MGGRQHGGGSAKKGQQRGKEKISVFFRVGRQKGKNGRTNVPVTANEKKTRSKKRGGGKTSGVALNGRGRSY